jgi:hypothetical protein
VESQSIHANQTRKFLTCELWPVAVLTGTPILAVKLAPPGPLLATFEGSPIERGPAEVSVTNDSADNQEQ